MNKPAIQVEDRIYTLEDFTPLSFKEDYKTEIPIEFEKKFWRGGGHSLFEVYPKQRTTFTKELVGYLHLKDTPVYKLETKKVRGLLWNKDKTEKVYIGKQDLYVYITTSNTCFTSCVLIKETEEVAENYKSSDFTCTFNGVELSTSVEDNFFTPKRLWYKILSSNDKTTKVEVYTNNSTASMEFYNDSDSLKAILESEPTEDSPFTLGY